MIATLSLQDYDETNRIEIGKLIKIAESNDVSDASHHRFSQQSTAIEFLLRTVYQSAAIMALDSNIFRGFVAACRTRKFNPIGQ